MSAEDGLSVQRCMQCGDLATHKFAPELLALCAGCYEWKMARWESAKRWTERENAAVADLLEKERAMADSTDSTVGGGYVCEHCGSRYTHHVCTGLLASSGAAPTRHAGGNYYVSNTSGHATPVTGNSIGPIRISPLAITCAECGEGIGGQTFAVTRGVGDPQWMKLGR